MQDKNHSAGALVVARSIERECCELCRRHDRLVQTLFKVDELGNSAPRKAEGSFDLTKCSSEEIDAIRAAVEKVEEALSAVEEQEKEMFHLRAVLRESTNNSRRAIHRERSRRLHLSHVKHIVKTDLQDLRSFWRGLLRLEDGEELSEETKAELQRRYLMWL